MKKREEEQSREKATAKIKIPTQKISTKSDEELKEDDIKNTKYSDGNTKETEPSREEHKLQLQSKYKESAKQIAKTRMLVK